MLSERAKSRAQQRFFGMVRAAQKGEMENPSPEITKVASTVSKSDVKKMASTKHKGLPEKKKVEEAAFLAPLAKVALAAGKGMIKQKAKQVIKQKAVNVAKGAIPQPNRDTHSEGVGRAAIGAGIGAMVGGPVGAAVGGSIGAAMGKKKKVTTGGNKVKKKATNFFKAEPKVTSSEGVVSFVKKGLERDKKAKKEKDIKNRKAVPYAALGASYQPEGELVDEANKEERTADRYRAGKLSPRPEGKRHQKKNPSWQNRTANVGKRNLRRFSKAHGGDGSRKLNKFGTDWQVDKVEGNSSESSDHAQKQRRAEHEARRGVKTKGVKKEELSIVDKMLIEYSPNVTYQDKKKGKLGKSSIYSLRDKDESKKDFRKSHVKDVEDGYVGKGHKPTPGSLKKEEIELLRNLVSERAAKSGGDVALATGKLVGKTIGTVTGGLVGGLAGGFPGAAVGAVSGNVVGGKLAPGHPEKKTIVNVKKEEVQIEAKVDTGKDDEGKEDARNTRRYGHVPYNKHGHSVLRRSEHRMRRGDKKRPGHKEVNVETGKVGKEIGEGKETAKLASTLLKDKQPCAECGSVTHVTGQCPKKDHGVTESVISARRSKKKVSYRGATSSPKRDKDGYIPASHYNKKPAPVGEKHGDKSNRPKRPKPADVRAGRKKNETVRAALNRYKNYEREKAKAYAGDAKRKAAKTGEYAEGVMDIVNRYKKKKEEKKPQKAQDAGARARRVLKRREYQSKVSAIVPAELEDQKVWDRIKKIW